MPISIPSQNPNQQQRAPLSLDYEFQSGRYEGEPLWQVIENDPEYVTFLCDELGLELEAYETLQKKL